MSKTDLHKQPQRKVCNMALESDRTMRTSLPSTSTATQSRVSTKAVKPANPSVVPKRSRRASLQPQEHEQRQVQQKQLQQIRAIRRKRTVAFAVNHETISQPHSGSVLSLEMASAPECHNQFSAQVSSTRDIVEGLNKNHNKSTKSPTVNRDSKFSHASRAKSPSSTCMFQQNTNSSDIIRDHPEDLRREEQKIASEPLHSGLIRESSITDHEEEKEGKISINFEERSIDNECGIEAEQPILPSSSTTRLVVDVRSAEAAAATIPRHMTLPTSSCPVPVTPTHVVSCPNESICAAGNATTKKRKVGRPAKKSKLCTNQDREIPNASCKKQSVLNLKLSRKPKIKRVRYDMELVPFVEINKDLLRKPTLRFRDKHQSRTETVSRRNQCDVAIIGKPTICSQNAPDSQISVTIPEDEDSCNLLMKGSVMWIPSSRQDWEDSISEMKSVCTSAAFRRWSKNILIEYNNNISNKNTAPKKDANLATNSVNAAYLRKTPASFQPPLSQAFIKDRVQIDDPLKGYQIRHEKGGWLQGFLVWTNFTVWTQDFQWNSLHPSSGLSQHEFKVEGRSIAEDDGSLSRELQALPRGAQDPLDGGIVLKQVAEISLLGGLGCGEVLLRKAIEDIRESKSNGLYNYKYVVLQATEGSRSFYERMGFVRVGAVCRYRWAEYCANGNGSLEKMEKKSDSNVTDAIDMDPTTIFDPPPTFHGYRHWTYTNESSKSLDLHGGPSIMMCLKVEGDDKNMQHDCQRTVSTLLQPHLVDEKPVIQLFGNVSNPNIESNTPTRKSKRHNASDEKLGCTKDNKEQEQEQKNRAAIHYAPSVGATASGGFITTNTTSRRTSNRSKRGRNVALANSDYFLYGVKKERRRSGGRLRNGTECFGNTPKRRRVEKPNHSLSLKTVDMNKALVSEAVDVSLAATESEWGVTVNHEGLSSMKKKGKGPKSTCDMQSLPSRTVPNENKIYSSCYKGEKNSNIFVSSDQDRNSSADSIVTTVAYERQAQRATRKCHNENTNFSKELKSAFSGDPSETKKVSGTRSVSFTTTLVPTEESVRVDKNSMECQREEIDQLKTNREVSGLDVDISVAESPGNLSIGGSVESQGIIDPCVGDSLSDLSSPKKRRIVAVRKKEKRTTPLTSRQGAKQPEGRFSIRRRGVHSGHQALILPRKRSRKPTLTINKANLFKQGIRKQGSSTADFFDKVVIRRNVQNSIGGSILGMDGADTHKCEIESTKKGRIRWHYNGGLMIDHRYEYCYYFVLHFNEAEKSLTIVPLIKDGVFEEATGSEKEIIDESVMGRPRYECNILKTDKNWIRDAPMEDYVVVPQAVPVIKTPLVAREAWDILQIN